MLISPFQLLDVLHQIIIITMIAPGRRDQLIPVPGARRANPRRSLLEARSIPDTVLVYTSPAIYAYNV